MEEIIKTQKAYKKLGFTYLETPEIITTLNQLLSNYIVHYLTLINFKRIK